MGSWNSVCELTWHKLTELLNIATLSDFRNVDNLLICYTKSLISQA